MQLDSIQTPTLLIDQKIVQNNLNRMLTKVKRNKIHFRPHFKTHQSKFVGRIFQDYGVSAITVSSLEMAKYFAEDGWDNITVAFPINVREMASINNLAEKIRLNLLVANAESVEILLQGLIQPVGIFIKIDVGTHRTGILPTDTESIDRIIDLIEHSKKVDFNGFLAHAGHSYSASSIPEIMQVHESSTDIMRKLKNKYTFKFPNMILSTGDTPTCSVADKWDGLDELRPGNFIFYDLTQVHISSCQIKDIAVCMAVPVVAKHTDRHEIIVMGGGIHLSKDRLKVGKKGLGLGLDGKTIFGVPVKLNENGWENPMPENYVRSLSQEHGVINCSKDFFTKVKIGDLIGVLPVHSCMVVDLVNHMMTTNGKTVDVM